MTTALTLDVDTRRFLAHLPHFFSSLSAAVAEMLQNSTRAQATTVDITIARAPADDAWVLTLVDDGPGIADPENLFTAARTGWDESQIIEPAGMGFFALLGLAQTLTVTSRSADGTGWQAVVSAQAFTGEPFSVTPLVSAHSASGLTVQAVLKPEADVSCLVHAPDTFHKLFTWRHAFPLTVRLYRPDAQGDLKTQTIPSHFDPASCPVLSTHMGSLYRGEESNGTEITVMWEHRLIRAKRNDLITALVARHGSLGAMVAWSLPNGLVWVLPKDTPVRAQLPERSALITNSAWHETLAQLADALVTAFQPARVLAAVQDVAQTRPDVLTASFWRPDSVAWRALPTPKTIVEAFKQSVALPPFFAVPDAAWLMWAGYVEQTVADPFSESGDWEGEMADGYEGQTYRLWMKNAPVTSNELLANQLCWHGFWTAVADSTPDASVMTVTCQDLEWAPPDTLVGNWLVLGRARQIVVERDGIPVGTVPWMVQTVGEDEDPGLVIADQGSTIGYGDVTAYPLPLLIQENRESSDVSFWDYVYAGELDLSALADEVTRTAQHLWDHQAVAAREAQDQTACVREHWTRLRQEATALLELVTDHSEWVASLTAVLALEFPDRQP